MKRFPHSIENIMPAQRVPIEHLKVGVYIHLDLKWYEHPFFLNSFKIKNADQIEALRELGLTHVVWIPEKSERQPAPPSKTQAQSPRPQPKPQKSPLSDALWHLKKERIEQFKQRNLRIQRCEKRYQKTFDQIKATMQNLVTGSEEAAETASDLIHGMVDTLLSDQEVVLHLMNIKGKDEGVYYHTLNVGILSLLLAKEYGLGAEMMQWLGMGAVFHDIGKYRIPKKILYKKTPLTQPERELVHLHPKYGEEIASRIKSFPEEALKVIRQHHESNDGKGYPDGLRGNQISLLAKIISVANAYDNLCNQGDPAQSMAPHEALAHMFRNLRHQFDHGLLSMFIRCMGVYPPGTIVQLSNEIIGMVVSINMENQLRPNLLVYDPEVPKKEALIWDLNDDPDLSIVRSIRPSQLPPEIYAYLNPRVQVSYFFDAEKD